MPYVVIATIIIVYTLEIYGKEEGLLIGLMDHVMSSTNGIALVAPSLSPLIVDLLLLP